MDAPYLASLHLNHAKLVATHNKPKRQKQPPAEPREIRFVSGEVTEEVVAYIKRVAEAVDSALEGFSDEMRQLSEQQLADQYVTTVLSHSTSAEVESNGRIQPADVVKAIRELYHQGLITFREQFYRTSQCKFLAVLQLLDGMESHTNLSEHAFSQALTQIRVCAHLNIATCLLNRQASFEKALRHCGQALQLDQTNVVAMIRSAQICCELHR